MLYAQIASLPQCPSYRSKSSWAFGCGSWPRRGGRRRRRLGAGARPGPVDVPMIQQAFWCWAPQADTGWIDTVAAVSPGQQPRRYHHPFAANMPHTACMPRDSGATNARILQRRCRVRSPRVSTAGPACRRRQTPVARCRAGTGGECSGSVQRAPTWFRETWNLHGCRVQSKLATSPAAIGCVRACCPLAVRSYVSNPYRPHCRSASVPVPRDSSWKRCWLRAWSPGWSYRRNRAGLLG